jgi:hypothetical protein
VDSLLWARCFDAEHEERRVSIKVHLETLDNDVEYELQ